MNRVLETARKERAIGSPLEASVAIEPAAADVPSMVMGVLGRLPGRQLADICLTSQAFAGVDARARSAAAHDRMTRVQRVRHTPAATADGAWRSYLR